MQVLLNGLKAAAEPTRLRILALCAHGEVNVSDLTQILGQSQPRVSRHLKLLVEAGLVDRFREGTFAFFRLADDGANAELARTIVNLVAADDDVLVSDLARLAQIKEARAAAASAYFRENADRWDEIRALHIDEREVERAMTALLPTGDLGDVLDLGTGTGRILALLSARANRAVGIDLSREMLAVARANLERLGLRNWQIRQGDLYGLPLGDASFDLAVMHLVLHYIEDPADAIVETARVLRPGGRLLIVDFAAHGIETLRQEQRHRWLGFTDGQIGGWLSRAGFETETPVGLTGTPLTVKIWPGIRRSDALRSTLPAA